MKDGVHELTHWITVIDKVLAQYEVSLEHSSLVSGLTGNTSSSPFIEQASSNLIWNEATRLSGDPFFGMRLYRSHCPPVIKLLSLAVSTSPDVGSALNLLIRFFAVMSSQVHLELRVNKLESELILLPKGEPHIQHIEAVLGYLGQILNQLDESSRGLFQRATVNRRTEELALCQRLLKCDEVIYGAPYSLAISREMLDTPLPSSDPFICSRLTGTLQEMLTSQPSQDLVEQVKRRIQLLLGSGDISVERIASPLNISPRHLRRKLSQEGTSYEQLVEEVRRETAIRMIGEGTLSLTNIAYELGFLDPSSFTRAFRRWTNMSPTRFRQQIQEPQRSTSSRACINA